MGLEERVGGRRSPLTPAPRPGEPGLLVAPVSQQSPFLGYAGKPELAQGKLLKDVFRPGDVFFNTGDLLVCDGQGFLRFHDRTGDTFRYLSPPPGSVQASDLCGPGPLRLSSVTPHPNPAPHLPSDLWHPDPLSDILPPQPLGPGSHRLVLTLLSGRWKGENVATTEVAEALEALDFLQEVNVYGVTVPGAPAWELGGTWPPSLRRYNLGTGSLT